MSVTNGQNLSVIPTESHYRHYQSSPVTPIIWTAPLYQIHALDRPNIWKVQQNREIQDQDLYQYPKLKTEYMQYHPQGELGHGPKQ